MASKALLVFALLLAAAFLVASANEQTQAKEEEERKQVYRGYPQGRRGYPGRGGGRDYPYGGYPVGGGGGGGYPGRGRHCRWGCRCCFRPDEIPEPRYRQEVQN